MLLSSMLHLFRVYLLILVLGCRSTIVSGLSKLWTMMTRDSRSLNNLLSRCFPIVFFFSICIAVKLTKYMITNICYFSNSCRGRRSLNIAEFSWMIWRSSSRFWHPMAFEFTTLWTAWSIGYAAENEGNTFNWLVWIRSRALAWLAFSQCSPKCIFSRWVYISLLWLPVNLDIDNPCFIWILNHVLPFELNIHLNKKLTRSRRGRLNLTSSSGTCPPWKHPDGITCLH